MKKLFKALGRIGMNMFASSTQAAYVSMRPFRTNRRLRHLESQMHEMNNNNDELQEEIVSRDRKIKFLKRDLRDSNNDTTKQRKDAVALRRWIATVHRLEIPSGRKGSIDKLISQRNEINDPEDG